MDRPLCGDEVLDLQKLGQILQNPETYGVTLDRGTNPEAARIFNETIPLLVGLWDRRKHFSR